MTRVRGRQMNMPTERWKANAPGMAWTRASVDDSSCEEDRVSIEEPNSLADHPATQTVRQRVSSRSVGRLQKRTLPEDKGN